MKNPKRILEYVGSNEAVRPHSSEKALVDLTWAIAAINAWNRVAISCRSEVGSYQPAKHKA